jgi:S1-C subfamily serine protease
MSRVDVRGPISIACFVALLLAPVEAPISAQDAQKPVAGGGWLGVILGAPRSAVGSDTAAAGVPIDLLVRDGPADRSGLRGSDLVLAVDGEPVAGAADLVRAINGLEAGRWITLEVERGGRMREIRVRVGSRPEDLRGLSLRRGWAGIEAIDLPPDLRERFGAPREAGVMISGLVELGPAAVAGLGIGDVVFEVSGAPVRSTGDLASLVARAGVGNTIEVRAARDGAEIAVEMLVDDEPLPEVR